MKDIIIPILTFLFGFYLKQFFDNRDLRRKILEPVFEEFENNIIYFQTEWRIIQARNINNKDSEKYTETYNIGRAKLIKSKTNIIFACKKMEEKELSPLIQEAVTTLLQGISGYSFFIEQRDSTPIEHRKELIDMLDEANSKFDETFPIAMENVYERYWKLISSTLIWETIKSYFNKQKTT